MAGIDEALLSMTSAVFNKAVEHNASPIWISVVAIRFNAVPAALQAKTILVVTLTGDDKSNI